MRFYAERQEQEDTCRAESRKGPASTVRTYLFAFTQRFLLFCFAGMALSFLAFWGCGDDDGGDTTPINASPTVEITSPLDLWTYMEGEPVELGCQATDEEDGDLDEEAVEWRSDIDGLLGTGLSLTVDDLSVGVHTITVTATDSQDASAVVSGVLTVRDPLEVLVEWMTGSFSSEDQAATSDDPYHVDVRLKMVRIWRELEGGYWVYVEQAYADSLSDPYRQRIYRVFLDGGKLADEIFAIPDESSYVGSWETPEDLDAIGPGDLTLKDNCGLTFEWRSEKQDFYGATSGEECTASIPGVSYLTSESEIHEDHLTSWDLGYDSNGNIVMGPYSPYIFDKLEDFPALTP